MNYLLLLSNVIKTNTTCPLSGGGYSCMCDGGAIYCPSVCIEYCSCKTQCYFLACGSGGRVHPDTYHIFLQMKGFLPLHSIKWVTNFMIMHLVSGIDLKGLRKLQV